MAQPSSSATATTHNTYEFQPGGPSEAPAQVRFKKKKPTADASQTSSSSSSAPSSSSRYRSPKAIQLVQTAKKQADNGRRIFYWLFMSVSGIFTLILVHSVTEPYEVVEHQSYFMDDVPLWGFEVFYIASIVNFVLAATICKLGLFSKTIVGSWMFWTSLIISCLSAGFWLPIIFDNDPYVFRFYMLPFSNLVASLLAVYVDRDARVLIRDAEEEANYYEEYIKQS